MSTQVEPMGLSDELVQQYHEEGFIFPDERLLSEEEIQDLLNEVDRICSGETKVPPFLVQLENFKSTEDEQPTEENPIRKLQSMSYVVPAFEKLARDPRIVDKVESILGPNIKLYTDEYFCKNPARDGKAFNPYRWHQDATGYNFFAPLDNVITCWIALDRATPENGCMQFIPKSHIYGSIPVQRRASFLKHPILADPIYAPIEPGCAVFHHGLNFHGSDSNQSDKSRRAIAFHYMRADTLYLGIEEESQRKVTQVGNLGNDFRFMLIRGQEIECRV